MCYFLLTIDISVKLQQLPESNMNTSQRAQRYLPNLQTIHDHLEAILPVMTNTILRFRLYYIHVINNS